MKFAAMVDRYFFMTVVVPKAAEGLLAQEKPHAFRY